MNPNVLPTGGYLAPDNLLLVLLDNQVYGSTAGLPTYANRVDLAGIAEASGWTAPCRLVADYVLLRAGPQRAEIRQPVVRGESHHAGDHLGIRGVEDPVQQRPCGVVGQIGGGRGIGLAGDGRCDRVEERGGPTET